MPDFRSYAQIDEHEPAEIVLSPEETHHLVRVNRARKGDTVVVFDGTGREWICECAELGRQARLAVQSQSEASPRPFTITLAQALPKGKTMDSIVRKATELGVSQIVPLLSERTEVQLEEKRSRGKQTKWEAAAIEAAKQCGNPYLPRICPVRRLSDYLSSPPPATVKLIASLHPGAKHVTPLLDQMNISPATRVSGIWLIGPEGDFTPEEMETAERAGFSPVSLGPLVMRCDTAAIFALGILNHELQHRLRTDQD